MQIAVPRTTEVTNVQNHLNQKPGQDQAMLANQMMQQTEKARKRSAEVDASAFLHVKEDGGRSGGRQDPREQPKKKEDDMGSSGRERHPFKGKHIDISL